MPCIPLTSPPVLLCRPAKGCAWSALQAGFTPHSCPHLPTASHVSCCPALQEGVLARMMEQILQCKDDIAQQYLMQCVIQGFPDEFHLGTLDALLGALPSLQAGVRIHIILASILDRLARWGSQHQKGGELRGKPACLMPSKASFGEIILMWSSMDLYKLLATDLIGLARRLGRITSQRRWLRRLDRVLLQACCCVDLCSARYAQGAKSVGPLSQTTCTTQGVPSSLAPGLPSLLCAASLLCSHIQTPCCSYAEREKSVVDSYNSADAFGKLSKAASDVAEKQQEMSGADLCAMYIALLGFIGKVYPDKLDNMDQVLIECHKASLGSAVVACLVCRCRRCCI